MKYLAIILVIFMFSCSEDKGNPDDLVGSRTAKTSQKSDLREELNDIGVEFKNIGKEFKEIGDELKETINPKTVTAFKGSKSIDIKVYHYTGNTVNVYHLTKPAEIDGQWVIFWLNGQKYWLTGNIKMEEIPQF